MMSPGDLIDALDDADQLVQVASALRNKFILSGWTSQGSESMTELIVAHTLGEAAMVRFNADEDDEPEGHFS